MNISTLNNVSYTHFTIPQSGFTQNCRLDSSVQAICLSRGQLLPLEDCLLSSPFVATLYERPEDADYCKSTILVSCHGFFDEVTGRRFIFQRRETSEILGKIEAHVQRQLSKPEQTLVKHLVERIMPKEVLGSCKFYPRFDALLRQYSEQSRAVDFDEVKKARDEICDGQTRHLDAQLARLNPADEINRYFSSRVMGVWERLRELLCLPQRETHAYYSYSTPYDLARVEDEVVKVRDDLLKGLNRAVLTRPYNFVPDRFYTNGTTQKIIFLERGNGIYEKEVGESPLYKRKSADEIIAEIERELGMTLSPDERSFISHITIYVFPITFTEKYHPNGEYDILRRLLWTPK